MKQKVQIFSSIILGVAFMFVAVGSYSFFSPIKGGAWQGMSLELTFISNFSVALFLLISGILVLRHKKIPNFLFFDAMMLLLLVFLIVLANYQTMNFSDGFQFLHVVNPIVMFTFWLIFISHRTIGQIKH